MCVLPKPRRLEKSIFLPLLHVLGPRHQEDPVSSGDTSAPFGGGGHALLSPPSGLQNKTFASQEPRVFWLLIPTIPAMKLEEATGGVLGTFLRGEGVEHDGQGLIPPDQLFVTLTMAFRPQCRVGHRSGAL